MRRSIKVLLVLLAFTVLLVGGAIFFTLPHWLIRVGFTDAKGAGAIDSEASIYKSSSGDILFLIPEDLFVDCYVFSPSTGEISLPSCSQVHIFGIVAFSNESPIQGVLSSDRIKVETDMNIVITEKEIEFTTLSGRRIKVKRDFF